MDNNELCEKAFHEPIKPKIGDMIHFVVWSVCKPAIWVSDAKLYVFDDPGAYYLRVDDYAEDSWHTIADCTTGYEASHTNTCNSFTVE